MTDNHLNAAVNAYGISHDNVYYSYEAQVKRHDKGPWMVTVLEFSACDADDGEGRTWRRPIGKAVSQATPVRHELTLANRDQILKTEMRMRNWAVLSGRGFLYYPAGQYLYAPLAPPMVEHTQDKDYDALRARMAARLGTVPSDSDIDAARRAAAPGNRNDPTVLAAHITATIPTDYRQVRMRG